MTGLEVRVTGPLADGRAQQAVIDFCEAVETSIAWQAHAEAMQIMDASFRNPTPYYELQVTVQRQGEQMVLHDRGIVYGPWLVGVSARNRTSRFKGYDMYRRAVIALKPKLHGLIQHALGPFLGRMG